MEDSIFTKIVKGDVPSYKVYEDDTVLAFLDIYAVVPGHTLVIPKRQVEFVWDLDEQTYEHLMRVAKRVAKRLRGTLGTRYVGQKIVGVDVPHAHVHLIPFDESATFQRAGAENAEPDATRLKELADRLYFS